eukprot:jgi/Bigna1/83380/fgenesh1_pg.107_\
MSIGLGLFLHVQISTTSEVTTQHQRGADSPQKTNVDLDNALDHHSPSHSGGAAGTDIGLMDDGHYKANNHAYHSYVGNNGRHHRNNGRYPQDPRYSSSNRRQQGYGHDAYHQPPPRKDRSSRHTTGVDDEEQIVHRNGDDGFVSFESFVAMDSTANQNLMRERVSEDTSMPSRTATSKITSTKVETGRKKPKSSSSVSLTVLDVTANTAVASSLNRVVVDGVRQPSLWKHFDFQKSSGGWKIVADASNKHKQNQDSSTQKHKGAGGSSSSSSDTRQSCGTGNLDMFLGGYCALGGGQIARYSLTNLPPSKLITITGRVHFFDRWKGEYMYLKVNGQTVWIHQHKHCEKVFSGMCKGINVCGDERYADTLSQEFRVTTPHYKGQEVITLEFGSSLPQGMSIVSIRLTQTLSSNVWMFVM